MRTRSWRFVVIGIVGVSGGLVERVRFGATDNDTLLRVEAELRTRFDADSALLTSVGSLTAAKKDAIQAALVDPIDNRLFEAVAEALPAEQAGRVGVTVYDAAGVPLAWAGRVTDLPKSLVTGLSAVLTVRAALGPRLVRVDPVSLTSRNVGVARDVTVVVEKSLADPRETPGTDVDRSRYGTDAVRHARCGA